MTLTHIPTSELPPLGEFLSSVAPGIDELQENIHFKHQDIPNLPKSFNWPLSSAGSTNIASLTDSYLNISRPALNPGPGIFESNTYVSLPYHITSIFNSVIETKTATNTLDGGMQIAANVGSMMPDPFHLVHLNPGCLTDFITLDNNPRHNNPFDDDHDTKNPFAKLTSNFNKLLKPNNHTSDSLSFLFDGYQELLNQFSTKNQSRFNRLINYNESKYNDELTSVTTLKLMISANVNVINVIALDQDSNCKNTAIVKTDRRYTPLLEHVVDEENAAKSTRVYHETREIPILRFDLKNHLIVTSMKSFTFNRVPMCVFGLNLGEILVLNLKSLKFKILLSHQIMPEPQLNPKVKYSSNLTNTPITALDIIHHPAYHFVVVAGTSKGEMFFLNPFSTSDTNYNKYIEDRDNLVIYFKKFDLSPFNHKPDDYEIIGHMKVSYKPITCIDSTVSKLSSPSVSSSLNPMLLAFGSDDGLLRMISLVSTQNKDYGSQSSKTSVISDVISNYFHCGIRDVRFSPDFKFLAIAGNGDVIELFRLGYFNVGGLIHKSGTNNGGRRSRSTTVNSTTSGNPSNSFSLFLSPTITSPSSSFDVNSTAQAEDSNVYPPAIKDIKLTCRLKGHTNTINKVHFIKEDQILESELESVKPNGSLYRLLSIGHDGKVLFWEIDHKALPKIRKTNPEKSRKSIPQIPSQSQVSNLLTQKRNPKKKDVSLNLSFANSLNGNVNNMTSILQQSESQPMSHISSLVNLDEFQDQLKGIQALYTTLYETRMKKHYLKMSGKPEDNRNNQFVSIIHPIQNDKSIPSIDIPVCVVDFSFWINDGKIADVCIDGRIFWCMGSNGDIIKYTVD